MGFLAWFSVWTTPHLNADQAIHILMAERFDVARDAYYWGQDRLGSLLPALGAVLVALGVPSLDALAWVQLGVLLASGLVWLRLLRNPLLGALGFAAMLLPVFPFHESVAIGHPYLAQQFFWLLWLSVLDRGTVSQGGALRAPRPMTLQRSVRALRDRDGDLAGLVIYLRDVTEVKSVWINTE
jgi:hypothetical protein